MTDQTTLEQKRAQAKAYKGVSYDSRIDRFIAAITTNGERRHLGSFVDAGDASVAYDTARDAHPLFRSPRHWAKTTRQQLIEFSEKAQRDKSKRNFIVAGQIFEMVGGQRFRLERTEVRKGNGWYIWSSRCYCCGALFEQFTTIQLRKVTGLTRTCHEHRGKSARLHDAPEVWPDPAGWDGALQEERVLYVGGADAATLRMHEGHKDDVFNRIKNDPELVARFYKIENEIEIPFLFAYERGNRNCGKYDWLLAWKKKEDPYAALTKVSSVAPVVMPARLEDMALLAEEPPADNDDLL